ncbi:hypothetical protein MVEN_00201100 [Mycena venus]|uniref:DUF6534 domain-containing protein n=1 Tax=Mycena venus TaxID=2733690 RepID=A0A8H6YX84_9AGAR|nr:hypothetical protein MVEN_00201100 [Mycena venus]
MGLFDTAFGTTLIGTWASSLLAGLAVAQAAHYFSTFPNDSWTRKGLVIASLLFTFVALVGAYADAYLPLVTLWGNPAAFSTETWSVPVYTIFNSLVGFIVNSYLISRFYTLSKNIFITLLLEVIALTAFAMAFISTLLFPGIENFKKAEAVALIWAIATAASDVLIATSLIWTLGGMKASFKDTKRLIRRVIIRTIQNGCATSLVAIAGMIAVIFKIQSNIPTAFFFLLGSLYVLTLLSNFNLRDTGKSGSRNYSSSRNNPTNSSIVLEGIHVRRTTGRIVDPTDSETRRQQDGFGGSLNQKHDLIVESIRAPEQMKVIDFAR